jgi:hypothetical protein
LSWIWQCCLTSSANLSASIYLLVDIKKNSKNIWPNVPKFNFQHSQQPNKPCHCGIIENFLRCNLFWCNTVSSFNFLQLQQIWNSVTQFKYKYLNYSWI